MFGYNPEDFLKGAIERIEIIIVGDDRINVENHWSMSCRKIETGHILLVVRWLEAGSDYVNYAVIGGSIADWFILRIAVRWSCGLFEHTEIQHDVDKDTEYNHTCPLEWRRKI